MTYEDTRYWYSTETELDFQLKQKIQKQSKDLKNLTEFLEELK